MKRKGRRILAFGLILLLVMGTGIVSVGASVTPTMWDGNQDPEYEGYLALKIPGDDEKGPLEDGVYYGPSDFRVEIHLNEMGTKVSFEANFPVSYVYVKGGPLKGNVYAYDPPVLSDTNLQTPSSDGGGKTTDSVIEIDHQISHVTFYYKVPEELILRPVCTEKRGEYRFSVENPNPYDMVYTYHDGEVEKSGTVEAGGYDLFYTGDMEETIYWIEELFSATAESDGAICKYEVTIDKEWYDAEGESMDEPNIFWEINIEIQGTEESYKLDTTNDPLTIEPEFDQTVVLSEGSGPEWNVTGTGVYARGDLYDEPTGNYMGVDLYKGAVIAVKNQQVPPPTGLLIIDKEVWFDNGGEELEMKDDDEGVFVVDIMDGEMIYDTLTFTGWETKSIDLPLGTYELVERPTEGYRLIDYYPSATVELTPNDDDINATIQNEWITGSLTINKMVYADDSLDEGNEVTFTFNVEGPKGFTATPTIEGNGSITLYGLEPGSYVVTEVPVADYFCEDPIQPVLIEQGYLAQELTFSNYYEEEPPVYGSITIVKEVWDGETMITSDTTPFEVVLSFGEGGTLRGDVVAGTPLVFDELSLDYAYVVRENVPSGYDLIDITPTNVILTENTPDMTVTIRNSVDEEEPPEETYSLTIQKRVVNTVGTVISTNARTFTAVVTGPGEFNQNVTLVGNDTETLTGLGEGTYTVTETAPTNYDLLSITPNSVTLGGEVESATVVITNEYDPPDRDDDDDDDDGDDNGGGGTIFIDLTEEVEVVEPVPQAPALPERPKVINPPEEEITLDEPIPEAPGTLPQTGEIPPTLFYWFGLVLSGLGFSLRKRR